MATQIQVRRGLAAAWTTSNPTLAQGELGFEIDTGKYKIGDGLTVWASLTYASVLPAAYELALEQAATAANSYANSVAATAEQSAKNYTDTAVSAVSTTTGVSEGTNLYFTTERAQDAVGNNLGAGLFYTDSQGAIGVDYSTGLTIDYVGKLAVDDTVVATLSNSQTLTNKTINTASNDITIVAADISDVTSSAAELNILDGVTATTAELNYTSGGTSAIQTQLNAKAPTDAPTFTGTVSGITKSMVGLGNVDNTTDANKPISTATQTALDLKAPKADPTFTGTVTAAAVTITGNLTVQGTTTTQNTASIEVQDPLIYIGTGNTGNALDLGFVAHFDDGTYQHTGFVRDSSEGKWKLFRGVTTEPGSTVDFSGATLDALALGTIEATSATIGNVSNTELQYLDGVTSAIQTQIDSKLASSTAASTYAPIAGPTFTGTVTLPSTTGIGSVTGTEIGYLSGVTSAIQTQISAKLASATAASTYAALSASQTITGTQTLTPAATTAKALVVKGLASQSANLQEWQNSSGTAVAAINNAGRFTAIVIDGGTA